MKFFLVLPFTFFGSSIFAQQINWTLSNHWKIYSIRSGNALGFSVDSLTGFKSTNLEDSKMRYFLSQAISWPRDKYAVWMGLYVATYNIGDSITRKIDISTYGGFFYDEGTKSYYEVPVSIKNEWITYLHDVIASIRD
jgi:hypothetical protein